MSRPTTAILSFLLVSAVASHAAAPAPDAAVARIAAASGGRAEVVRDGVSGEVRLVRAPAGALNVEGAAPAARASDALRRYGAVFGITDADRETFLTGSRAERLGGTVWMFEQRHDGVPVFGAELRVRLDRDGRLTSASGVFVPDLEPLSAAPRLDPTAAAEIAVAVVRKDHPGLVDAFEAIDLGEAIYRRSLVRGLASPDDHLVRRIEVRAGDQAAELVLVEATDGRIVERIPLIHDLRRVIHLNTFPNQIWSEGDPLPFEDLDPVDNAEVNEIITASGETYRLFENLSGGTYLSWNGNDVPMNSVHASTGLACPNAQWTGNRTRFCLGTGTDDVVAHEWTHAYTQGTHGLIYLYQPGALNESYSDIFGEVVDFLNRRPGGEVPTIRTYDACTTFAASDGPRVVVTSPPDLGGDINAGGADYNPIPPWTVAGTVELAVDGVDSVNDGCEPLVGFTPGNIALLEFGRCLFRDPIESAQAAGAIGAILVNRANDNVIQMPGAGDRLDIPAVMIGRSDGDRLRAALEAGVEIRLSSTAELSDRWLVSEDAVSFGGAIRDMWAPGCFGDPGSVLSANYYCGEGDNGGVHINSSVPNRAFALAVDGGDSPFGLIRGIGLTKAAHVYWRAMSVYQGPTSDFADHADLVAASCDDLVGAPLTDLETGAVASDVIEADDCAQLAAAAEVVQLRADPIQCGFEPILAKNPPQVSRELVLLDERFDSDPGPAWNRSTEGIAPTGEPAEWTWTTDVPDGGDGGALWVSDLPLSGGCSSRLAGLSAIDTPAVTVPTATRTVLVFDHYVASEESRDGGNLKISVNGGPFELVGASAFLFNPYNGELEGSGSNPNLLAGEPAWHGTDEGSLEGSWGQSQVDLSQLVAPGDTVRIRFEFGNDVCVGDLGWFVDNVRILAAPQVRRIGGRTGA